MGQNHRILKSGHHTEAFYEGLWNSISAGNIWHGEIKNRAKDGSFYWVDTSIAPIFGGTGAINGYIAVRIPITNQKQIEEALERTANIAYKAAKESEEKTRKLETVMATMEQKNIELENTRMATMNILEDLDAEKKAVEKKVEERTKELTEEQRKLFTVTEHMDNGAVLLDHHGQVLFFNRAIKELVGFVGDDVTGFMEKFFEKFSSPAVHEQIINCVKNNITRDIPEIENGGRIYEMLIRNMEGNRIGDAMSVIGTLIFVHDNTETKLLERSKSELVAVASHQLRTPLTAMRGNVEMLVDESFGVLNKEQHELLDDIKISTTRLIMMVNDMLDITKIEKGRTEMVFKKVNLAEIILSIINDLETYAVSHHFTITHDIPDERLIVLGDSDRLRQIFQNIIDNAIKYSRPSGTLDVTFSHLASGMVEVQLRDNGIGIPEDEHTKMFGRFYRASNISRVSSSGSGLGLYIVKSFVELMHGTIRFESKEGEGTTFFVTLPTKHVGKKDV